MGPKVAAGARVDELVERACARTGLDDLGRDSWRPGLGILAARERIGEHRFFDLHYADLMRDPVGLMRSLYAWAGDELTPAVERSMLAWLRQNPRDRFGTRPYSLDAYGLTANGLEPVFADYVSTFDVELEGA